MTNPIFDYGRSDGCASITGGAFVPNGIWPAAYDGTYLFADYVCGRIFQLVAVGLGGFTRVDFADALGASSAVHLDVRAVRRHAGAVLHELRGRRRGPPHRLQRRQPPADRRR